MRNLYHVWPPKAKHFGTSKDYGVYNALDILRVIIPSKHSLVAHKPFALRSFKCAVRLFLLARWYNAGQGIQRGVGRPVNFPGPAKQAYH